MIGKKVGIITVIVLMISFILNFVYFYSSDFHFSGSFSLLLLGVITAHICFMYYWDDRLEPNTPNHVITNILSAWSLWVLGPIWLINAIFLFVNRGGGEFISMQVYLLPYFYLLCIFSLMIHYAMRRVSLVIILNKFLIIGFSSFPAIQFYLMPLLFKSGKGDFDFNIRLVDEYLESDFFLFRYLSVIVLLVIIIHLIYFVVREIKPKKLYTVFE